VKVEVVLKEVTKSCDVIYDECTLTLILLSLPSLPWRHQGKGRRCVGGGGFRTPAYLLHHHNNHRQGDLSLTAL